jgi:hypothetical protein
MPAQFFGAQAAVTFLNRAFANTSPSNAAFNNQVTNATASLASGADATQAVSYTGFAKTFGSAYANQTPAALSTLLMTNLGLLPNAALETALADYITAAGTANVGVVALQLATILSTMEGNATYGAAATAWNNEVNAAATYSVNTANTTPQVGDITTPPVTQGQTYTLTAGVDNITGTNGDDTISAYINTTTATVGQSTLSGADVVGAGAGTDTLNLSVEGADGTGSLTAATITGIEKFFIRDLNGNGASTYNFGTVSGETQAWNDRSTQAVTFSNLATGTTVGIKGDNSNNVSATTFSMATATDAVAIAIDGGVKGGANITRAATGEAAVTITSTGAANTVGTIDLDNAATTVKSVTIDATTKLTASLAADYAASSTLTLKGAGAIDLSGAALSANITTVNAADNSGGVTVTVGANTATVTGGTGNDTVSAAALVFNSTGSLNGGAGTDTLVVQDEAQLTAATVAKMTNFEVLRTNDDNDAGLDTFNTALITGLTGVVIGAQSTDDGVSLTNVSAAVAGDITIAGSQVVGPTIGVSGAATVGQLDTLTLKINDGATAVNTLTVANVTAAGVETVKVVATDNLTLQAATGLTALTKLEVSGSGAVNVTTGGLALNVNTVVDASAATGAFTFSAAAATTNGIAVTGSSTKANTITGSGQADAITGGAANDTITAGNGIDSVNISQGGDDIINIEGIVAVANRDVITGFTVGTYAVGGGQDRLEVADAQATTAFGPTSGTLQEVTSAPTSGLTYNTAANNILELAFELSGNNGANDLDSHTNGTGLLAALGQTVAVSVDTNAGYIVAYQDGKAYLYHAVESNDAGNADLAAADVLLVGVFNGVAVGGFTASNFIDS